MTLPADVWSLSQSSESSRDSLIKFWLTAPIDQLEALWFLDFGVITKKLVRELHSSYPFTPEQLNLRTAIGNRFNIDGLNHPLAPQLMIANFLLSPPGLLTVNNVEDFFPDWLASAYSELYVPTSDSSSFSPTVIPQIDPVSPSNPDFGPFPESLEELVSNRIHLNRILGLSNLYYIDPDDKDICSELQLVRTALANLINSAPESRLEYYWSTDLGDRYWALVRSGIQKESLSDTDLSLKKSSTLALQPDEGGGFGLPGSINAFLITMMYFMPGTITVPDARNKLPSWIFKHYSQIFAEVSST